METRMLQDLPNSEELVRIAQQFDEPVIVLDGEDECLIAMRPAVFERILFDTDCLNLGNRSSLRF